ncbi:MAG: prepilin-type cleavage/methylation domain-containing protein, partial [Comamonas sp.]
MTLVELLVALLLGSLIVLAAVAALTVSRQGFLAVDASAQLRDNARFATSIIRRLATQAAYLDFKHASTTAGAAFKVGGSTTAAIEPSIKGFNDAAYDVQLINGTTNAVTTTGLNNSDMLVVRYQMGTV